MRLTQEEFERRVKKQGNEDYIFLEKYQGNKKPLLIKHKKCGYEWKTKPDNFFRGKRCPLCGGRPKIDTRHYIEEVKKLDKNYQVLSEYKSRHEKVKMLHLECNNIFEMSPEKEKLNMAKRNFIKLIQIDKKGNAVTDSEGNAKYDTFITPTQIPFRKIYDAANLMDDASNEEASAQENIEQMLDMVVDIYNNQFTKDDLLDRLHAPDAVEELQQQIQFIAQGEMDDERKKKLAQMI
jgi:hypothetical protein